MFEFCICDGANTEHCPFHDPKIIAKKAMQAEVQVYGNKLDQILLCAEQIQQCTEYLKTGQSPLFTLVGVMDWVGELHRVMGEIKCSQNN